MKLMAMLGAGALAAGTLVATAAPADAQRYGYRYHGGYHQRYYGPRGGFGYRGHYRPVHRGYRYAYRDRYHGYRYGPRGYYHGYRGRYRY